MLDWVAAQQQARFGQVLAKDIIPDVSFLLGCALISLALTLLASIWWQQWLWVWLSWLLFGLLSWAFFGGLGEHRVENFRAFD